MSATPTTRPVFVSWQELLAPGETHVQRGVHADEKAAKVITSYSDYVITGLLQTRAYALGILTEVIRCYELPGSPEDAADARIARQDVLNDPDKTFRLVLHENALYFQVGDPTVMVEQMNRLEHLALHDAGAADISWGILPRTTPYSGLLPTRSFSMYDDTATEEAVGGSLTITDPTAAANYHRAYNLAAEQTVRDNAAAELVRMARDHWRSR